MSIISVEHINPFLAAAKSVLLQVGNIECSVGKLTREESVNSEDGIIIIVGVTGSISGRVIFKMSEDTAKYIASTMMMGLPVTELDAMAQSALSELGNMVMGTAATQLSEIGCAVDITPPALGKGKLCLSASNTLVLKVPLEFTSGNIELYFMLKLATK